MPRHSYERREIGPDWKYGSVIVYKLINKVMWDGRKRKAEKIVYGAFDVIKEKTGKDPLEVFEKAVENLKPELEVRPRRVGGATYLVPLEVPARRQIHLALKWLVDAAREKKGRPMREKLAQEILDAYNQTGSAYKKKIDMHKMAEANKAFIHYRW